MKKILLTMALVGSLYADCEWIMTVEPMSGDIVEVYVCT